MAKNRRPLRDGLSNPFDVAFETDPAGDVRPAHFVIGEDKLTPASPENPLPVAGAMQVVGSLGESIRRGGTGLTRFVETALTLAASATQTVVDITDPAVLEYVELTSNGPDTILRVDPYDANGNPAGVFITLDIDGRGNTFISPAGINNFPSGMFDLLHFDATLNHYKIALRRPLHCPNGVKIAVQNPGGASVNAAIFGHLRGL